MRILRRFTIVIAALLATGAPASALDIPAFTPNVVDTGNHLDAAQEQQVNEALERIRASSHVWGAVYILDSLGGEPIENVAVEAFERWALGQKGVDNGLLLVLAMSDRESRFEVGYGLEGAITDLAARRALDDHLAPRMREGDPAGAIIAAFEFLARVVAHDPDAMRELETAPQGDEFVWDRGLVAWGVLLAPIWLGPPLQRAWTRRRRERLRRAAPTLSFDDEQIVKTPAAAKSSRGALFLQCFLSVNPGVFVLIFSALHETVFYACVAITLLILAAMVVLPGRRYASPERYRAFLDRLAKQRAELIGKGHLEETSPGVYAYTPAYHASVRASSSSSSGGSGFSSSSGGGRSGGGGASSRW